MGRDMTPQELRAVVKAVRDMPRAVEETLRAQRGTPMPLVLPQSTPTSAPQAPPGVAALLPNTMVPSSFEECYRRRVQSGAHTTRVVQPSAPELPPTELTQKMEGFKWRSQSHSEVATTKDYAPIPFLKLQGLLGYDPESYARAWDLDDTQMTPKIGAGRSGSLFLASRDKQLLFKTIPRDEVKTLRRCLSSFYTHFFTNPSCLIACAMGLHKVVIHGMPTPLYLVVFSNVTNENLLPRHPSGAKQEMVKFDLKGRIPKKNHELKNLGQHLDVLKDKDLNRKFTLTAEQYTHLHAQLQSDIDFLAGLNLMDYSILVGVIPLPNSLIRASAKADREAEMEVAATPEGRASGAGTPPLDLPRFPSSKLQTPGVAGLNFFRSWFGAMPPPMPPESATGGETTEVFCLGIIDYLTNFGVKKAVANALKRCRWSQETLSTVRAMQYSERMKTFSKHIFVPCTQRPTLGWVPSSFSGFSFIPAKCRLPELDYGGGPGSEFTAEAAEVALRSERERQERMEREEAERETSELLQRLMHVKHSEAALMSAHTEAVQPPQPQPQPPPVGDQLGIQAPPLSPTPS